MSAFYEEYASIVDNGYNNRKVASRKAAFRIKSALKPLLSMLKRRRSAKNCAVPVPPPCESLDNSANELLEQRLFAEIDSCRPGAAIWTQNNEDSTWEAMSIYPGARYVPVRFARTEAGTFFWTTITPEQADQDLLRPSHCYTECQAPCMQDRWVQA